METDNFLPLAGIQHYAFCPRQWALIYIEQAWEDNVLTVEGRLLHERVDNPLELEARGDLFIARSVYLASQTLGLSGIADVVDFRRLNSIDQGQGALLPNRSGYWMPHPVEYKRGRPKRDDRDKVQLCAQAICLEELLGVHIEEGDLFYGEIRRRQRVVFDTALRKRVYDLAAEMHVLFAEGVTPPAKVGPNCRECSLVGLCLPKLAKKSRSVARYLSSALAE